MKAFMSTGRTDERQARAFDSAAMAVQAVAEARRILAETEPAGLWRPANEHVIWNDAHAALAEALAAFVAEGE